MTMLLELNDLGIRCYQDGQCLHQSPGIAIVESQLLFGEEALAQCRWHPLNTYSQFWSQLNTEPLQLNHPQVRHHADLAFLHLQHIEAQLPQAFADQPVIFSLPAATPRDSLGLLLGISQQCGLKPLGLVDQGLAAVLTRAQGGHCWHIDMRLHDTLITELRIADQQLQYLSADSLADTGWLSLQSHLLKLFSDWFIQQTRFNPRHGADTEQALFDSLPEWLRQCQNPLADTLTCELGQHRIQIETRQVLDAVHAFMRPLQQRVDALTGSRLFLGDHLSEWASLLLTDVPVTTPLPASAVADNLSHIRRELTEHPEGVRLIRQLPCETANVSAAAITPAVASATHLLHQHRAYPLQGHFSLCASGKLQAGIQPQCLLSLQQGKFQSEQPLLLGGQPYDPSMPLLAGDQLQLGDLSLTLIRVED